jgi:hypothetical protein
VASSPVIRIREAASEPFLTVSRIFPPLPDETVETVPGVARLLSPG